MKKFLLIPSILSLGIIISCANNNITSNNTTPTFDDTISKSDVTTPSVNTTISQTSTPVMNEEEKYFSSLSNDVKTNLSASGYINDIDNDFSKYVDTDAYRKVSTAEELIEALYDAKNEYSASIKEKYGEAYVVRNNVRKNETNWISAITKGLYLKETEGTYTKIPSDTPFSDSAYTSTMVYYEDSPYINCSYEQTLINDSKVHVIEIVSDINLGYKLMTDNALSKGIVSNFIKDRNAQTVTMSDMANENGISQIAIERTNDLLIYSKNGSKLTHAGFKINYSKNISIRNLSFDEMWQWEDTSNSSVSKMGDYDTFGWSYFKIGFSDQIWIDHCTFGKAFDGLIDVSNQYYSSIGTYQSAPFEGDGSADVHISWCSFLSGSDDKDGYIYKMMKSIEEDYQNGNNNYLYYKALRDSGMTFDDILYGIAIPQKKAFLDGDSGTEYYYNLNMNVSIGNCYFKNVEDRIPKVRGGNAYMYNTIVDNFEYMEYRTKLKSTASSAVSKVNSSWKCAFVSQGIVVGNGGSVYANGCIFKGIDTLIKNNDSTYSNNSSYDGVTYNGGYHLTNFIYQKTSTSDIITDENKVSISNSVGVTNTTNFKWNTTDRLIPFEVTIFSLDNLENILNDTYGVGTNTIFNTMWLISCYN